jgi:hypothetical protein
MTDDNSGFTPVANAFLTTYAELNITPDEAIFIIHYLSYKWTTGSEPSIPQIAKLMGKHHSNAQKHVRSMEEKGLLKRVAQLGKPSVLDFSAMFEGMRKHHERNREGLADSPTHPTRNQAPTVGENANPPYAKTLPYKEERIKEPTDIPAAPEVETTAEPDLDSLNALQLIAQLWPLAGKPCHQTQYETWIKWHVPEPKIVEVCKEAIRSGKGNGYATERMKELMNADRGKPQIQLKQGGQSTTKTNISDITGGIGDDLDDTAFERRYGIPRGALKLNPELMDHVKAVHSRLTKQAVNE